MRHIAIELDQLTHDTLNELAAERGMAVSEYLTYIAKTERHASLLQRTNEAYARLQQEPSAWAELQAERGVWEATLADGLDECR